MNEPNTPTPSPYTRDAILAVLRLDPAITPVHRAKILAAFDGTPAASSPLVRAVADRSGRVKASVAAAQAGVAISTVTRWCESGEISSERIGDRITLVNLEEVIDRAKRKRQHPAENLP